MNQRPRFLYLWDTREVRRSILIRVERAKRLESRNISEEEQVAAVAAPAREKRESILTPKMAALQIAKASKRAKADLAAAGLPKTASIIPAKPGEPRRSQRLLAAEQKKS